MDYPRAKLYFVAFIVILLIMAIVALVTYLRNYIQDREAEKKRKIKFRKVDGKEKGYRVKEDSESYDPDLKLED